LPWRWEHSPLKLEVGHILREFEAKHKKMKLYLSKVQNMQSSFQKFCIVKILREDNEKVDRLGGLASTDNSDGKVIE
jgi:hypothetical protein